MARTRNTIGTLTERINLINEYFGILTQVHSSDEDGMLKFTFPHLVTGKVVSVDWQAVKISDYLATNYEAVPALRVDGAKKDLVQTQALYEETQKEQEKRLSVIQGLEQEIRNLESELSEY